MQKFILNRLQVNNTSTKCFTVWVATPMFIRFFDIGNYYISCSYLGILKVVSQIESQLRCWSASRLTDENETSEASKFKREDMRLNLHCEFVDWIEAFQLKKASLIAANLWLDFIFNVIQWRTLNMIFVPFIRISNLLIV